MFPLKSVLKWVLIKGWGLFVYIKLTTVSWSQQTRGRSGQQGAEGTAPPPPASAAETASPMSRTGNGGWPAQSEHSTTTESINTNNYTTTAIYIYPFMHSRKIINDLAGVIWHNRVTILKLFSHNNHTTHNKHTARIIHIFIIYTGHSFPAEYKRNIHDSPNLIRVMILGPWSKFATIYF